MPLVLRVFFSESILYVGTGDSSTNGHGVQNITEYVDITGAELASASGNFTLPGSRLRGGFRYLRVLLVQGNAIRLTAVPVYYTATPDMHDPRDWHNHFYSSDDLLNRIWYGCGWTAMLCTIGKQSGRDNGNTTAPLWMNNGTASLFGHSALVDGAKRDSEC